MAARVPSRGLGALLKRGWNEVPDIVGSSLFAIGGVFISSGAVWLYYQKDGDNRRYKEVYTVIRHDDPRADKVRKD